MKIEYIGSVIVAIAYLIFFYSRFRKTKKQIIITDSVSRVTYITGYALMKSINSIEHITFGLVRNLVSQYLIDKSKKTKYIATSILLTILITMYALSFNGLSTIIFIVSALVNLYATMFTKAQGIRIGSMTASLLNALAFLVIGNYVSIIGELLCFLMSLISFIKEKKNIV